MAILGLLACLTAGAHAGETPDELRARLVAPIPSWVVPVHPPDAQDARFAASGGEIKLLSDQQTRSESGTQTTYLRFVTQITSGSALAANSSFRRTYDPTFESYRLHSIFIHRGNERIDALSDAFIEILRQETRLAQGIYDGRETLYVRLDDVRVGDIVDYTYSYVSANPVAKGRFSDTLQVEQSRASERVHFRVSWPESEQVSVRPHPDVKESKDAGGWRSLSFGPAPIGVTRQETGAPGGMSNLGSVKLSSFESWADVAALVRPGFENKMPGPETLALIDQIKRDHKGFDAQMTAAIRFVQDEIRYHAITLGIGGWVPRDPDEILRTRFGDCKDKSLLLAVIARALGAEADVALVHTSRGAALGTNLPSMYAFNHAIAQIRQGGRSIWVDGTRSLQGGGFANMTQPSFNAALILSETTQGLTVMTRQTPDEPDKRLVYTIDASQGAEMPAMAGLSVTTQLGGADTYRQLMAQSNPTSVVQQWLAGFETQFGPAEMMLNPIWRDDRTLNSSALEVMLSFANPYQPPIEESKPGMELTLRGPNSFGVALPFVTRKRTLPLAIFGGRHEQTIYKVTLPPGTSRALFDPETFITRRIDNAAFSYLREAKLEDNQFTVAFTLQTKVDQVPPEDATGVFRDMRRMDKFAEITVPVP
jgi:transglutaminase-like putative cysteine protease